MNYAEQFLEEEVSKVSRRTAVSLRKVEQKWAETETPDVHARSGENQCAATFALGMPSGSFPSPGCFGQHQREIPSSVVIILYLLAKDFLLRWNKTEISAVESKQGRRSAWRKRRWADWGTSPGAGALGRCRGWGWSPELSVQAQKGETWSIHPWIFTALHSEQV